MQRLLLRCVAGVVIFGLEHVDGQNGIIVFSNDTEDENSTANQSNDTQTSWQTGVESWAKPASNLLPRFTWESCLCMQTWRLLGFAAQRVVDYCGNPDNDGGGDWCFVVDASCQPFTNWGYCAPPPRCSVGDGILVNGQARAGVLHEYRGQAVVVRWPDSSITTPDVRHIRDLNGHLCVHQRTTTSTWTFMTTPMSRMYSTTSARQYVSSGPTHLRQKLTTSTTTHRSNWLAASNRPRFNSIDHGPALALRLNLNFATTLQNRYAFEASLIDAVAAVVLEPREAVAVLAMMPGSIIVAIGVVPDACSVDAQFSTTACTRALILVRQRWEVALYTPNSALRQAVGQVDSLFPAMLDATECSRRNLVCPWITSSIVGVQNGCGSGTYCQKSNVRSSERDPWWFMSLIAFAGAAPTCLCVSVFALKIFLRMCRCLRQQRHVRVVHADACSLPRIEVSVEDLHLGEDWVCSICLGELCPEGDLLLFPCKHTLHYDCAIEWLERRLTCPMCRSPFRIRDCAIYTTPSLVTSFHNEQEEEKIDEVLPAPVPDLAGGENRRFSPRISSTSISTCNESQSCLMANPPLPNAILDEEEPWWAMLPSTLANRACPSLQDL